MSTATNQFIEFELSDGTVITTNIASIFTIWKDSDSGAYVHIHGRSVAYHVKNYDDFICVLGRRANVFRTTPGTRAEDYGS